MYPINFNIVCKDNTYVYVEYRSFIHFSAKSFRKISFHFPPRLAFLKVEVLQPFVFVSALPLYMIV
jgi:hypothetical protein